MSTIFCRLILSSAEIPVVHVENETSADVTTVMVDVINETTTVTDYFAPTGKTYMKSVLCSS